MHTSITTLRLWVLLLTALAASACAGGGSADSVAQPAGVTLSASPDSIVTGDSSTLTWTSTDATTCTASGAWSGAKGTSGSVGSGPLTAASNVFTLTCDGAGGSGSASVTVSVAAPVAPTVTLGANPANVASGGSSTLTWSSTGASGCTASGAWSGSRATSGTASTGALTAASNMFNLSCAGAGGTAQQSVTVTVAAGTPAPTVSLVANPLSVTSGDTSTLTWSTTNATSCTASGAWIGSRPTAGTENSTALTASNNTFTLTCMGAGGSASKSVVVTVSDGVTQTGLDFQGSESTGGTVRFRFRNPLAIYPATYIWRVYPRQQSYYYTTFFWGNDDGAGDLTTFQWDNGSSNTFYGAHPYPNFPDVTTHHWEIATDHGGDFVSNELVVYDRWYTQALVAWSDGSGRKHTVFYWDLPDTSKTVTHVTDSTYGNTNPPQPALTWGDAPWNPSSEIMDGVIRGIQIYSIDLSIADVQAELATPQSTSAGASNLWYLNLNPTPTDISDKSGNGHNPAWVGSGRALLWTGP